MRNMFIAFSRLLYCFTFDEKPTGQTAQTGDQAQASLSINELEIDPLAHDHPPFNIKIAPRSRAHIALIERECKGVGVGVDVGAGMRT